MASSLISGAVVLILILIAGYVITDGILTIAEKGVITKTEMTLTQENILHTSFNITSATCNGFLTLTLNIKNTGSTSFNKSDLGMDLYLRKISDNSTYRETKSFSRSILNDITNKGFWDPSENLRISYTVSSRPSWVQFVTPNGITASSIVI